MAITTVQAGSSKLRVVRILSPCIGPGGAQLAKKQMARMPENDAYTLVSGQQAEFVEEDEQPADK